MGGSRVKAGQNLDRAVKRVGDGSETDDEPLTKRRKPEDGEITTTTTEDDTALDGAASNAALAMPEESKPVAVKVRMTVTSGFYVRSFVHE